MPFKLIQIQVRRFIVVLYCALILVLLSSMAILASRSFTAGKAWVDHTTEVVTTLQAVQTTMLNAETGQRGYILTGEDIYLAPYNEALLVVHGELKRLRDLVSDNRVQSLRVDTLEQAVGLKLAELKLILEARRRDGMDASIRMMLGRGGKNMMDRVRLIILEMIEDERVLMNRRLLHVDDAAVVLSVSLMIIVVRDLFVLALVIANIRHTLEPQLENSSSHGESS